MGAFDAVLNDVGSRFGISTADSGSLLSALLSFITQQEGGLRGFLDRFQKAGMGGLVSSWLGGETKPIAAANVEEVLGHSAINNMASKSGLSFATAASAIAFMLPKLIQRLAPGGTIPTHLPAEIMSYSTGATAALASGARHALSTAESVANDSGVRRFLWPVLGLLLALLLGIWLWSRSGSVPNASFNATDQVRIATEKATAALSALGAGFTAQSLVSALNFGVVNFATASAQISPDNFTFLNRAAEAIKAAPPGTVIEIGGHTDNTGDAASNLPLSQQRADAVRDYLIKQGVDSSALVAKGYGDSKPVTSNDTEEGKFHNRRIEFSVIR